MSDSTVLVTGASGFVGGRIVELLAMGDGARPRAMIRGWSRAARVARFPVEIAVCDILNRQQVAAAMEGVKHVVHCAYTDDPQVIIEGTRHLLTAAREANVKRFVFLSTAEVYGPHVTGDIDETAPIRNSGQAYADAKIEAENLCRRFNERGLPVAILRPSIVYGPFGKSWTVRVAQRLASGRWAEFDGYGDGFCNAVYVDDLVSAVFLALADNAAVGEVFNVNGPDIGTWNEYFRRLNDALGLPALRSRSATASALKSAAMDRFGAMTNLIVEKYRDRLMELYLRGGPMGRLMKHVKTMLNSTPSTKELENLYSRRAVYIDHRARELLGYRPAFDLETGIRASVLWLAHHGLVDSTTMKLPPAGFDNGQSEQEKAEDAERNGRDTVNQRTLISTNSH
jgi:nucleoside-diphosphate-sugar epimerase